MLKPEARIVGQVDAQARRRIAADKRQLAEQILVRRGRRDGNVMAARRQPEVQYAVAQWRQCQRWRLAREGQDQCSLATVVGCETQPRQFGLQRIGDRRQLRRIRGRYCHLGDRRRFRAGRRAQGVAHLIGDSGAALYPEQRGDREQRQREGEMTPGPAGSARRWCRRGRAQVGCAGGLMGPTALQIGQHAVDDTHVSPRSTAQVPTANAATARTVNTWRRRFEGRGRAPSVSAAARCTSRAATRESPRP